jgi:ribose 5-phosphate isomerase A
MKQAVAAAAVEQIKDGMVVGLGSGSTAALMIEGLAEKLRSGDLRDITGVTTSFQGEVLAAELGIPLKSLNAISHIDLAIDGADEVDPAFQLIKGGGACHVQEKLVARRPNASLWSWMPASWWNYSTFPFCYPLRSCLGPGVR